MTTTEIFQRTNSHRKCQGRATKTLPERKDIGKCLPSNIYLTMYLVWRVQVLNTIEMFFLFFFFLLLFKSLLVVVFFGVQRKGPLNRKVTDML